MEYDVDICRLSPLFYEAYPHNQYREILWKIRPYTCLLIDTHEDYLICIPFRSNLPHKYGFPFKKAKNSKKDKKPGLDYKKVVLIKDNAYIDTNPDAAPIVNPDEYRAVMSNARKIAAEVMEFIQIYKDYITGTAAISEKEFTRRYRFSTVPYFEDILGI